MSAPNLSTSAQLRYILEWFGEFSELQREDFLPVLAAAQMGQFEKLATALAALSCDDKPVSLFQCRLKLFNEWYPTWSKDEQERLIRGISNTDQEFAKKLEEALIDAPKANGLTNGTNGLNTSGSSSDEQEDPAPEDGNVPDNIPVEIVAAS